MLFKKVMMPKGMWKNMKKIKGIFLLLVILGTLSASLIVYAVYPTGYTLGSRDTGFAELSTDYAHSSPRSVKMGTVVGNDLGEIVFAGGPQLEDITQLSYWTYTVQAGTFGQLTAWMNVYLHAQPGKTLDDWYTDYFAGSPDVYYIQAEPYYVRSLPPQINIWEKWDAFDSTYPLEWYGLEGGYSPHYAPTLTDYVTGAAMNYPKPGGGTSSYASREYGTLYICAIKIRMGYGGPWVDTLAYVDDVTIYDYFENFDTATITIDIKPKTYPNDINLRSRGRVPVAVLTTDVFDASTVDPVTVTFAGASPVRWTWKDVDSDGDVDILFFFKTQELDLPPTSTEATLIGKTFGDLNIVGTDTVNIVP